MSHLNLLATIHTPVSAVGKQIVNSFGVTIATATDTWQATAIAALINLGAPGAQAENDAYDRKEALLRGILIANHA
jgi:predicted MFS family arabinose efflux permease